MKLCIISFTENGILLSQKIAKLSDGTECTLYSKCSACHGKEYGVRFVDQRIGEWAEEQFHEKNAMLFIGACGIAVRAIAPYITDKLHDSPVLVMDEKGKYVIPVLSGHAGGANELAVRLAKKINAEPVITTATDLNRKFAVDLFAIKNGLIITNKDGIAKVSSKVLSGEKITMSVEQGHLEKDCVIPKGIELTDYPPLQKADVVITSEKKSFDSAIILKPKEYVIGIGCKKGKERQKIEAFILKHLEKKGISLNQVWAAASIDVKKNEPGLVEWSRQTGIPFITYTSEELQNTPGDFQGSEFVKRHVGVDNVCERAALKLSGQEGRLIYEKYAEDGMTIAIAKRNWRVSFDEE